MIIGLGSDIVNIKRIEKSINRFGNKFKNKIYSEEENAYILRKKNKIEAYAARWAAKEACLKALGIGVFFGISFKDIIIKNEDSGKPYMMVYGEALKRLNFLMPLNYVYKIHLTISHDFPFAQAMVLIEGTKKRNHIIDEVKF